MKQVLYVDNFVCFLDRDERTSVSSTTKYNGVHCTPPVRPNDDRQTWKITEAENSSSGSH